jgi:hypothetical protein
VPSSCFSNSYQPQQDVPVWGSAVTRVLTCCTCIAWCSPAPSVMMPVSSTMAPPLCSAAGGAPATGLGLRGAKATHAHTADVKQQAAPQKAKRDSRHTAAPSQTCKQQAGLTADISAVLATASGSPCVTCATAWPRQHTTHLHACTVVPLRVPCAANPTLLFCPQEGRGATLLATQNSVGRTQQTQQLHSR